MISIESHGLLYSAVPKAGCSSVKAMLATVDPEVELPQDADHSNVMYHRIYATQRFAKYKFLRHPARFKFTVIRDPIRRLMSVYTNRVRQKRDLVFCRKIRRGRVDLPTEPDPDFFFQHFDAYREASARIKHHALPTYLFTGRNLKAYDRVYRTEELGQLGQDLQERTGVGVSVARANKSREKLEFADLHRKARMAVRAYLDAEYHHLRDYFQNPLA